MSYAELGRFAALGIGGFQTVANAVLLLRGFSKIPEEIAREGATPRIADLLRTAWVYGMLGNLCIAVILLSIAGPLRAGEPFARFLAGGIGVYYMIVGVATYAFGQNRHAGMLAFVVFGVSLVTLAWLSR